MHTSDQTVTFDGLPLNRLTLSSTSLLFQASHYEKPLLKKFSPGTCFASLTLGVIQNETNMNAIKTFLAARTYAVAGASAQRHKYGNIVFRALTESGREVYPLNPGADFIESHKAYARIADLPVVPESLSLITPPAVTRMIVADAIAAGVKNLWMQPGAEDESASNAAREAGLNVIDDGSCVLVVLATMKDP